MRYSQAKEINRKFERLNSRIDSLKSVNLRASAALALANEEIEKENTQRQLLEKKIEASQYEVTTLVSSLKGLASSKSMIIEVSEDLDTAYYYDLNKKKKQRLRDFRTWSVQPNLNYSYGNFDRLRSDAFYTSTAANLGYGIRINKQLSPIFSTSLDAYRGEFSEESMTFSYSSKINYQISVLAQVQVGNIKFTDAFKNLLFYGNIGYGIVNFEATSTVEKNGITKENSVSGNSSVVPFGLGVKHKFSEKSAIAVDYVFNYFMGDNLEGYSQVLSNNDTYNRFSLAYVYTIGTKKKENLTWYNPFEKKYSDLYEKQAMPIK